MLSTLSPRTHGWVAVASTTTSAEISARVGLGNDATKQKRGMVVRVGEYYGYHDGALWQKIDAWKELT